MGTRLHINYGELSNLHRAISNWSVAREQQALAVEQVMDILECDADEAVDLLNTHSSGIELVDRRGIELHSEKHCAMPWFDGETLSVWGLIITGVATAIVLGGLSA